MGEVANEWSLCSVVLLFRIVREMARFVCNLHPKDTNSDRIIGTNGLYHVKKYCDAETLFLD